MIKWCLIKASRIKYSGWSKWKQPEVFACTLIQPTLSESGWLSKIFSAFCLLFFFSVPYRHRGLDPSSTRYSKCMNLSTTTIYLSWQAALIQFCLDADQNVQSKVQEGSFRSQKPYFWGAWFIFSVWPHIIVVCSQIFSLHILWKSEKYHSAISIIRAECIIRRQTLKTILFKQRGSCAHLKRDGDQPFTDEMPLFFFFFLFY